MMLVRLVVKNNKIKYFTIITKINIMLDNKSTYKIGAFILIIVL